MSVQDEEDPQKAALRLLVTRLLEEGLETMVEPVPEDNFQFAELIDQLDQVPEDDVKRKLIVSGYIDRPHPENKQRCLECMYYRPRARWCVIPELDLPAEAEWWCRLWRM